MLVLHRAMIVTGVLIALVGSSLAGRADEPAQASAIVWNQDVNTAWTHSQAQGQLLLLYIKTDSCLFCTKMERDTYANDAIVRHVSGRFVATSVDGRTHPELVRKLGVRVFPTTVIIGPEAQVLDSISGYLSPGDLQPRLEAASAKAATLQR